MSDTAGGENDQVTGAGGPVIFEESGQVLEPVKVMVRQPRPQRPHGDSNRFLNKAMQVVVDNYNRSRDPQTTNELTLDGVYIVWFAKTLRNWKAIVASPVVFGLLWEVSCDGGKQEIYIDVYKKVTNVKLSTRGKRP